MERVMNEENDLDRKVEGLAVCVSRGEVLQAINENMRSPWTFRSITTVDCC